MADVPFIYAFHWKIGRKISVFFIGGDELNGMVEVTSGECTDLSKDLFIRSNRIAFYHLEHMTIRFFDGFSAYYVFAWLVRFLFG